MTNHGRSNRSFDHNPDFVAKLRALLGKSNDALGLRDSCTHAAHDDNLKAVAAALQKASEELIAVLPAEDPWATGAGAPSVRDQLWPQSNRINGLNPLTACEAQWVNGTYPAGLKGSRKFFTWVRDNLVPRGCQGVETVAWRYNLFALLENDAYRDEAMEIHRIVPRTDVFSTHVLDQLVCDPIRPAHKGAAIPEVWGDGFPYGVNYRAGVMAMAMPVISKRLGLNDVNHGFCGGAGLWQVAYDFMRGADDIERGLTFLGGCWNPICDVHKHVRSVHALEIHGTEAAFDVASFLLSRTVLNRPEWGVGFDGSHFLWQRISVVDAIKALIGLAYHFHFKSIRFSSSQLAGIMRGLKKLNSLEGGWAFHTIGNGHNHLGQPESLEDIVVAINASDYHGNVSAENEQPGATPEGRMIAAIENIVRALYEPSEALTLPA